MNDVENKLLELNIDLPKAAPVAGNYAPYVLHNNLLSISGQTCKADGVLAYVGQVGGELGVEDGVKAARICALNVLAQVKEACDGDWSRIMKCIKLTVFVNSSANFSQQPTVANGASDVIVNILGEKGIHTRAAVGASSLPGNSAVEIDALFAVVNP